MVVWHRPRPRRSSPGAIDVEHAGRPLDPAMLRRWGESSPHAFLARWTASEVVAKLTDTPILEWVLRHGLVPLPQRGAARMVIDGRTIHLAHAWVAAEESFVTVGELAGHPGY